MALWYVVYTHPREEHVAEENLTRQGFAAYWPRYRKRVSHARRVQDVTTSLFPRYLFVAFDPTTTGWRTIRSTRGVVDLVRNGFEPTSVSAQLIDEMREREDERGCVVLGRQVELIKQSVIAEFDLHGVGPIVAGYLNAGADTANGIQEADFNGARLFQAARFATEMQYQHLVFEEFARKINPFINPFSGYVTSIDPSIVGEFAHTVYRFGHSMLTNTIDRIGPDGTSSPITLIDAFLDPVEFARSGAAVGATGDGVADAAAGAISRPRDRHAVDDTRYRRQGIAHRADAGPVIVGPCLEGHAEDDCNALAAGPAEILRHRDLGAPGVHGEWNGHAFS